ncbi:hypothetical protein [Hoeflea ulvae]|uniref:Twin-arginine translocation signal domain-containing protein n=1 Tax=Hoeflea ulvae TaxID=2983764 RepID=A0ABT3YA19_9HYPH|nr:hypothetical protein [Hoeflea ulvae]MCY0092713.1 hypothetical protein [Hoeflea ulvae]
MLNYLLRKMRLSVEAGHEACGTMSRRSFLAGAGTVIGTACISSSLGVADASAAPLPAASPVDEDNDLIELAQSRRREDERRRDDRGGRRRDDRGRRRDDRGGRRHSRRDLERQCRRSKRFRRENRRLCNQVTGRTFGRRGSCIQIGPLQICE